MDGRQHRRQALLAALVVGLALLVAAPLAQAQSGADPRVVPVNRAQALTGKSYAEWSAEWWKYAFSLPTQVNPLFDETGAQCAVGQSPSSPVFFLVGVFNATGTAVRNQCTVPAGKPLFFPILNVAWDNAFVADPARGFSRGQLRQIARDIALSATELHASVDGVPVANLFDYRTRSGSFYYTMPANSNLYGLTCEGTASPTCRDGSGAVVPWPGLTCTGGPQSTCTALAQGDGYYLMLRGLTPGVHQVNFGGTFTSPPFTLNVTYNLVVQ